MKNVVIYHGNCADGFCSAWIASRFLDKSCTIFIPANHTEEIPPGCIDGANVYILDFTYGGNRKKIEEIKERALSLIVLDHHKSAVETLGDLDYVHFDMNKSGAMLTWEYFSPKGVEAPWLVAYVQDRDLWTWKLPHSKEISEVIGILPHNFREWDRMYASSVAASYSAGSLLLEYKDTHIERILQQKQMVKLANYAVPAINSQSFTSELGAELAKSQDFSAIYSYLSDGRVRYSLRSMADNSGVDVSIVAGHFGGGGHRNAAGFVSKNIVHEVIK